MNYLAIVGVMFLSVISVCAQTEEDKQALRDLKAVYEQAIKSDDLSPLKAHLAKDFSAVMITGKEVKSYDQLDAFWKKAKEYMGDDASYSVKVNADDSLFIENIAIAKGTSEDIVDADGNILKFGTAWTAVCQKLPDGSWKLTRLQVTTHPVENPFAKMVGKAKLWITAMVTGFVALLMGLVLGRRMGYKNALRAKA
ncbi:MAG: YybH family protein [Akkermansiaceae bacterium]